MVINYAVMNDYFINESSPPYKTTFNRIYNTASVYTPKDTAIVTPPLYVPATHSHSAL